MKRGPMGYFFIIIRTQTMAGREQKAKAGKWNGGLAPYGYSLKTVIC